MELIWYFIITNPGGEWNLPDEPWSEATAGTLIQNRSQAVLKADQDPPPWTAQGPDGKEKSIVFACTGP